MTRVIYPIACTRNIGISAHIDSGKTTLTERVLFYTGQISSTHEVRGKDGVGAKMDSTELEIQKGITIQSAATYCTWNDHTINIIDTPGHVDFTIEVERALRVLDGAILVLCSVAGVQSQSITVDRQMRRYNVPCIAFVNKCDRAGADPLRVAAQLHDELGHNAVMIQHPIGLGADHEGVIDLVRMHAYYFDGAHGEDVRQAPIPEELLQEAQAQRARLVGVLAELDDAIATLFLEGEEVAADVLDDAIMRATRARTLTAVCLGSAYKNKGVQPLLDAIVRYLPSPVEMEYHALDQDADELEVALEPSAQEPLVMLAFKLEDGRYGQLTYCRVYQGCVNKGDVIFNMSADRQKHKVGRLVQMHSDEMHEIGSARAGDIVALFGIECASGDTFTDGTLNVTMASMFVPDVVVEIAVEPHDKGSIANFSKAISRFTKEDPTFRVKRDPESGQTIFGGMGELHLEIYIERIKREYGVEVQIGQPQVAYREALTRRVDFEYTHSKQTGGRGQYARVCGYMEPAEGEQDYTFVNEIVGGVIPKEYHKACARGFEDGMAQGGLIGFPMVNLRVCVNDGKAHSEDSSDQAFYTAARAALREVYMQGHPVILEPVMRVVVESPDEFTGAVMGGLNRRRGVILNSAIRLKSVTVTALVPLTEMFGYSNDLRSSTQGKAEFSMEFEQYSPVPKEVQKGLVADYNT